MRVAGETPLPRYGARQLDLQFRFHVPTMEWLNYRGDMANGIRIRLPGVTLATRECHICHMVGHIAMFFPTKKQASNNDGGNGDSKCGHNGRKPSDGNNGGGNGGNDGGQNSNNGSGNTLMGHRMPSHKCAQPLWHQWARHCPTLDGVPHALHCRH